MIITILIVSILCFSTISAYMMIRKTKYETPLIRVLSVLLFFAYLVRLFSKDSIDLTFNLFLTDIQTPINAYTTWLFDPLMTFTIIMLRWFTLLTISWILINSIYKIKILKWLISFVGLITISANILLFDQHIIAFQGSNEITLRTIQFAVETGLAAIIVIISLVSLIKNKELFIHKKELVDGLVIIIGSLFALMPLTLLFNFFGNYGDIPKDFNMEHLFVIIVPIILMIIIYRYIKPKSQVAKDALIAFLAIAAVFQYFYMRREDLAAWPLHLCNMAVVLIFFGTVFRIKSLFYFSYFATVLGAVGGIFLPNYEVDFFSLTVIHFGFNHMYVLIIPILGIALGTFEKPKLKSMYQAIAVFTVYFIVVIILNAWFNNYTPVDYFFAYSDFLPELFGALELKYQYIISFEIGNLTLTFYWLFQLIYYISFVFLMFVSWYIYDASFNAIDANRKLITKQKQMKLDHLELLKSLAGRKLEDPMDEKGVGMIKIVNFSKRYGKSNKFAVKNFSLEVGPGEIFGFLGHNGAGKSTTIKSMVGIQSITEGEVFLDGYSIKTQPIEAKLRLGYVSDNHAVYEKLTGREYIHYVADLYRVPKELRDERLEILLKKLSLEHAIDQEVRSYSHGMKQKLVVIASLIHEPPIWILDEPLTGLDPTSAYQIKESMREHAAKGHIVFFSSHVIEVVEKICTKIAVINQGELMGIYEMSELQEKGISLESLYMSGKKQDS